MGPPGCVFLLSLLLGELLGSGGEKEFWGSRSHAIE